MAMDMPDLKVAQSATANTRAILQQCVNARPKKQQVQELLQEYRKIRRVQKKADIGLQLLEMGYANTEIKMKETMSLYDGSWITQRRQ